MLIQEDDLLLKILVWLIADKTISTMFELFIQLFMSSSEYFTISLFFCTVSTQLKSAVNLFHIVSSPLWIFSTSHFLLKKKRIVDLQWAEDISFFGFINDFRRWPTSYHFFSKTLFPASFYPSPKSSSAYTVSIIFPLLLLYMSENLIKFLRG